MESAQDFHRKKITKNGNFDGLCKQTMRKYFQKRKLYIFFTEIKIPKIEILMDYVITSYHIQIDRISWLYNMITILGPLMAYLSRLHSLTKPNLT